MTTPRTPSEVAGMVCPSCGGDHSNRYSCIECGKPMCGDCVAERSEVHCAEWCDECVVRAAKSRLGNSALDEE